MKQHLYYMKDYSLSLSGGYTESWVDQIYGGGTGSRYVNQPSYQVHSLSGVVSGTGDFRNPIPQSYVAYQNSGGIISYNEYQKLADGRVYSYSKNGTVNGLGSFATHTDPGAFNQALGKLGDVIRGSIDLSVDAFQARQTVKLVSSVLSVRKAITTLLELSIRDESRERRRGSAIVRKRIYAKRRNRKDSFAVKQKVLSTPLKDLGSGWLMFQYGVKPTLQTLYDLTHGNATRLGNSLEIRGKTGFPGVTGQEIVRQEVITQNAFSRNVTVYQTTFRYKIGGSYTPSSKFAETMSRFTSLNPASIGWELLPFSFVIDWFVDVGGYLRAAETALVSNLGTFKGYQTLTKREEATEQTYWFGKDGNITKSGSLKHSRRRTSKTRTLLNAVPFPRKPTFKVDMGSTRLLNAAALLSQLIGKR